MLLNQAIADYQRVTAFTVFGAPTVNADKNFMLPDHIQPLHIIYN
jgi:hypothetical protein